ncbi:hypothetical protein KI387_017926 [Taxus chinensis]|uniref:Cytochrome P450 n=1 Tax=Taxus chinensis TaxID=29808 RepID=A0AA38LJH0_TAXCH|nr:hypothetical protein KI387_017926 [Taxus chinensis]
MDSPPGPAMTTVGAPMARKEHSTRDSFVTHNVMTVCVKELITGGFAGMDTIAITMEWAMAELVRNPRIQQKAQEELDRVIGKDKVLNETGHFIFTASRTSKILPEMSPNTLSGTELLPA